MTIPRKGRRSIVVDDIVYHWVSTSTTHRAGTQENPSVYIVSSLIVECIEHPGRRLQVAFDSRTLYDPAARSKYVDALAITPGVVVAAIRYARAHGWEPEAQGVDFRVQHGEHLFEAELRAALQKGSRWGPPS